MIRVIAIDVPNELASEADRLVEQLRIDLAALSQDGFPPAETVAPNKLKVQALIARCARAGFHVRVSDVQRAAAVDESDFFKWQRGATVHKSTKAKCERVIFLSADEFLTLREKISNLPS